MGIVKRTPTGQATTRANAKGDFEHLPPEQLVEDILKKEQRIMEIMGEIKLVLAGSLIV